MYGVPITGQPNAPLLGKNVTTEAECRALCAARENCSARCTRARTAAARASATWENGAGCASGERTTYGSRGQSPGLCQPGAWRCRCPARCIRSAPLEYKATKYRGTASPFEYPGRFNSLSSHRPPPDSHKVLPLPAKSVHDNTLTSPCVVSTPCG